MAKCKRNRNRAKRNFTFKTPAANRNYKDTVFRMLFSDRKCYLYGNKRRSGIYHGYESVSV